MGAGRAAAVALASLCLAATPEIAHAQLSARLGIESDYRNRGVSPSASQRAVILDLAYDRPDGIYAGGSLIGQDPVGDETVVVGHSEFLGYARRDAAGRSWDFGVSNLDLTAHGYSRLRYTEVYAGVSNGLLSARAHYSPNYVKEGQDAFYFEVNGAVRPDDDWRLGAHLGVFVPFGDQALPFKLRRRYDMKLSVSREFPHGEAHVSLQGASPTPPGQADRYRPRLGVGGSVFF